MSDNDPIAANDTGTDDAGPIVAPRKIRGRHIVGITAIVAVVALVAAYFIGLSTTSAESHSDREEEVLQAAVMAQAVEFGDFLLATRQDFIDERSADDASEGDKEQKTLAEENIGYDDVLQDAAEKFADESDADVDVHEIKDDNALPVREDGELVDDPTDEQIQAAEDEAGDEIDDNGLVQVQIGFADACLDLNELEKSGPATDLDDGAPVTWVTGGECEV